MAKKGGDGFDDFEMDDFGDFGDSGFDDFGSSKDDRTPGMKIVGGFKSGVKDHLKDPKNQAKLIKSALPDSYGEALGRVDDAASIANELYDHTLKEMKPLTANVKKVSQLIISKENTLLPKKWVDAIHSADEQSARQPSAEEIENTASMSGLSEVFGQQQAHDDQRAAIQDVKSDYRATLASKQNHSLLVQLVGIRQAVQKQVAYQDKITVAYQRKSLELQFKSYFVQRRHLDSFQKYQAHTAAQLETIMKNTGLPDELKIKNHELIARLVKERAINSIADWGRGLGRKFLNNAKREISSFAQSVGATMDMLVMGADMVKENEQFVSGGRYGMAGEQLGGMAAEKLMKRIQKPLQEFLMNRKFVKKGAQRLAYEMGTGRNRFSNYLNRGQNVFFKDDEYGGEHALGWVERGIRGLFGGGYQRDTQLTEASSSRDLEKATHMRILTRRTIEEVIPGWLSKIHKELAIIRTGDVSLSQQTYSFENKKFETVAEAAKTMRDKIYKPETRQEIMQAVENVMESVTKGQMLSRSAKEQLRKRLLKDAMAEKGFLPDVLANDQSLSEELRDFMVRRYNLQEGAENAYGQKTFSAKGADFNREAALETIDRMDRLGRTMPQIRDDMAYLATFNPEAARQLKITTERGGAMYLDEEAYMDRLMNPNAYLNEQNMSPAELAAWLKANPNSNRQSFKQQLAGRRGAPTTGTGPNRPLPGRGAPMPTIAPPQPGMGNLTTPVQTPQAATTSVNVSGDLGDRFEKAIEKLSNDFVEALVKNSSQSFIAAGNNMLEEIRNLLSTQSGLGGNVVQAREHWFDRGVHGILDMGKDLKNYSLKSFRKGNILIRKTWRTAKKAVGWLAGAITGKKNQAVDIFTEAGKKLALRAEGLTAGIYVDIKTGKKITSWRDITGPVHRIDRDPPEIVLTQEEFDKGIFNAWGISLFKGAKEFLKRQWDKAGVMQNKVFQFAKNKIVSAWRLVKAHEDIHVGGDPKPRLIARIMREGGYRLRDDPKHIVYSVEDIIGEVETLDGKELLISHEDLKKGLFNAAGEPINTWKGKLKVAAAKALTFGAAGVKWGWDKLKKAGTSAKDAVMSGWDWVRGLFTGQMPSMGKVSLKIKGGGLFGSMSTPIVVELRRIYRLLNRRMPGESFPEDDIPLMPAEGGSADPFVGPRMSVFQKLKRGLGSLNMKDRFNALKGKIGAKFGAAGDYFRSLIKRDANDSDNDGTRDSGWAARLKNRMFGKKDSMGPHQPDMWDKLKGLFGKAKEEASGGFSWVTSLFSKFGLGPIGTLIAGLGKSIGQTGVITAVGTAVGGIASALASGIMNLGGKALSALAGSRLAGTLMNGAQAAGGLLSRGGAAAAGALGRGVAVAGSMAGAAANTARGVAGAAVGAAARSGVGQAVIGTGLRMAGMAVAGGQALGAAGTFMAGLLTAPVLLTAGAVAAVGYLGYQAYKNLKNSDNYIAKFRIAQYGFDPGTSLTDGDDEEIEMIGKLEEKLTPNVVYSGGQAKIQPGVLQVEDLIGIFGVDPEDMNEVKAWVEWFGGRFRPVFLSHMTVKNKMVGSSVPLGELDKKLSTDKRIEFMKAVHYGKDGAPYKVMISPVPTSWYEGWDNLMGNANELDIDGDDVHDYYEDYLEDIEDNRGKDKDKKFAAGGATKPGDKKPGAAATTPPASQSMLGRAVDWLGDGLSKAGKELGNFFSNFQRNLGVASGTVAGALGVTNPFLAGLIKVIAIPSALVGTALAATGLFPALYYDSINDDKKRLTKLRMYQYGFSPDQTDEMTQINLLEGYVKDFVIYSKGTSIQFNDKIDMRFVLSCFNIGQDDDDDVVERFLTWFEGRFKPIYFKHYITATDMGVKLENIDTLKDSDKLDYVTRVEFALPGPYAIMISPFKKGFFSKVTAFFGMDTYKLTVDGIAVRDLQESIKGDLASKASSQKREAALKSGDPAAKKASGSWYDSLKSSLKTGLGKTLYNSVEYIKDIYKDAKEYIDVMTTPLQNMASAAWKGIKDKASDVADTTKQIGKSIYHGIGAAAAGAVGAYQGVKSKIFSTAEGKKLEQFAIDAAIKAGLTGTELAMFLAQTSEESGNFTRFNENLKYSAKRLMDVSATARKKGAAAVNAAVAQGESGVAELIYGGRKDLGNTQPGDGYKYRGRGAIQLTGRYLYEQASKGMGIDLVNNPDLLNDPKNAILSAIWYWKYRKPVRDSAQRGDIVANTKYVNGGYTNLEKRKEHYAHYLNELQEGKLVPDKAAVAEASKMTGTAPATASTATKPAAAPATGAPPTTSPTTTPPVTAAAKPAATPPTTAAAPATTKTPPPGAAEPPPTTLEGATKALAAAAPAASTGQAPVSSTPAPVATPTPKAMPVAYTPEQSTAKKQQEASASVTAAAQQAASVAKTEANMSGVVDILGKQLILQTSMEVSLRALVEKASQAATGTPPPIPGVDRTGGRTVSGTPYKPQTAPLNMGRT